MQDRATLQQTSDLLNQKLLSLSEFLLNEIKKEAEIARTALLHLTDLIQQSRQSSHVSVLDCVTNVNGLAHIVRALDCKIDDIVSRHELLASSVCSLKLPPPVVAAIEPLDADQSLPTSSALDHRELVADNDDPLKVPFVAAPAATALACRIGDGVDLVGLAQTKLNGACGRVAGPLASGRVPVLLHGKPRPIAVLVKNLVPTAGGVTCADCGETVHLLEFPPCGCGEEANGLACKWIAPPASAGCPAGFSFLSGPSSSSPFVDASALSTPTSLPAVAAAGRSSSLSVLPLP